MFVYFYFLRFLVSIYKIVMENIILHYNAYIRDDNMQFCLLGLLCSHRESWLVEWY